MTKRYKECNKDYMLYLLRINGNDGAGIYIEEDNIIRIDTYNYSFHICN